MTKHKASDIIGCSPDDSVLNIQARYNDKREHLLSEIEKTIQIPAIQAALKKSLLELEEAARYLIPLNVTESDPPSIVQVFHNETPKRAIFEEIFKSAISQINAFKYWVLGKLEKIPGILFLLLFIILVAWIMYIHAKLLL